MCLVVGWVVPLGFHFPSVSDCLRTLAPVWAPGQVTRAGHPLRSWLPAAEMALPQQLFQLTVYFPMTVFYCYQVLRPGDPEALGSQ